jgi:hypothetical protein
VASCEERLPRCLVLTFFSVLGWCGTSRNEVLCTCMRQHHCQERGGSEEEEKGGE